MTQNSRKRKELELLLEPFRSGNGKHRPEPEPATLVPPAGERPAETGAADIAVIGMSGRFPDSPNLDCFWENLVTGKNLIREIPPDRWDWRAYYGDPKADYNKTNVKHIGAMSDVFSFDAALFGISPREAEAMDPHQRVLLEVVWETLEHAGYAPAEVSGTKTGVFIAMYNTDFLECSRAIPWEKESLPYLGTGSSQAIVSNRISYLFNWQGPSEIVSTACSSALVGLHKAAQAIRAGDCHMALVGGVSLFLSPARMIALTRLGILSPAGYCAPFDKDSPGEVLGEGVGAVLLKSLAQARQDGDTIYAVIKATGTNHHGNSSGSITMPSAHAQRDLVIDTYRRAGIDPRTIGFIEAHGSGNVSGDMAELVAFDKAFTALSQEKQTVLTGQFCGLGSGKGNTGFLEAAGGMAQLIKVILSMQHQTLPATLNFKSLPDSIDLEHSPFYIVDKTIPWAALRDEKGIELPRRAAINSYGLGGTNAHIVVEEPTTLRDEGGRTLAACPSDSAGVKAEGVKFHPCLVLLSARDETRLKEMAKNLYRYVASRSDFTHTDLQAMAYTLQVGRKAMQCRLALVVDEVAMLLEKLQAFIDGAEQIEQGYWGQVSSKPDTLSSQVDEDFREVIKTWLIQAKLEKLARQWLKGLDIEWDLMYDAERPRRIALPTYPFARERYWRDIKAEDGRIRDEGKKFHPSSPSLHPLLHQNISDLVEQRYRSVLTGAEFFLRDHQINGEKFLPGVAYLEMARAAGELAAKQPVVQLKNIAWVRPIKIDSAAQVVSLALVPTGETLTYKIEIPVASDASEWILHGQGQVVFGDAGRLDPPDRLDLAAIQTRCDSTIQGADCYRLFAEQGRYYGPGFQTVREISYNNREALARLQLPALQDASQALRLHPGLLDGALQAIMGLHLHPAKGQSQRLELPFALERVDLYGDLPERGYAYVTYSHDNETNEAVVKYDIIITDEQGAIRLWLRNFAMRMFSDRPEQSADERGVLYSTPTWQEKASVEPNGGASPTQTTNTLGVTLGLDQEQVNFISTTVDQGQVIELPPPGVDIETTVITYLHQVRDQLWPLLADSSTLQQVLVLASERVPEHLYAPFVGLLKTAQLEHPKVQGKIITLPAAGVVQDHNRMARMLHRELQPDTFADIEVRYRDNGQREVRILRELELDHLAAETRIWLKPGGVYWITGGLGGLGQIFARHLIAHGQKISLILSGGSALDEVRRQQLAKLQGQGAVVQYLQVDVGQEAEVRWAFDALKAEYGHLNGIIHAAGVVKEGLIRDKSLAEADQVLAPKIAGAVYLDTVTQNETLDFMVLFSSIAGLTGHVKQWDYAAGNAFLDKFAAYRQQLVDQGKRSGRTLVLDWTHWQAGGMQADKQALKLMKKLERITGISSIETAEGLTAFDRAMAGQAHQVVIAVGLKDKLRASLLDKDFSNSRFDPASQTPALPKAQVDIYPLREQVILELKKVIARLLKIKVQDIADDEELQAYGFNSISFIAFINVLNDLYRLELTPTLVFEYNSLETLSRYLVEHHQAVLEHHYQASVGSARKGYPLKDLAQNQPLTPLQTRFRTAVTQGVKTPVSRPSAGMSPLVPIRSSGTRPPFFCIHPWAGLVYPYYDLADALGPDQPFYGLQAAGLYQTPHRSIEEMAGHYLEVIRTVQPAPPYLLGGWSLGGLIAFEMAQQLRQVGQDVALLALFDMPAPIANKTRSFLTFAKFMTTEVLPYIWPYVHDYFQLMASVRSIDSRPDRPDPEGGQATLAGRWHMLSTVVGEIYSLTSSRSTARRMLRTVKAGMLAGSSYVPQPYPGRATLFRVENQSAPDDEVQAMGWHKLVAQGVEVYHLPGHHFDILRKPYVQTLAGQLRACIDRVQLDYLE